MTMTSLLITLLTAPPDKNAKIAELISPILSGMAFILSAAAFIFTVFLQLKERRRNIRQTLSTALSELARINIDVSQLKKDEKESSAEMVRIIKNFNSQRGTLASNAGYLMSENEKLVTDADYELIAMTYADLGDVKKAEDYWLCAIKFAPNVVQKHIHQREYATFLYMNNRETDGRKYFEESVAAGLSDTDSEQRYLADTYLAWANLERNFENASEFSRLVELAKHASQKIRHRGKNAEMAKLIAQAEA